VHVGSTAGGGAGAGVRYGSTAGALTHGTVPSALSVFGNAGTLGLGLAGAAPLVTAVPHPLISAATVSIIPNVRVVTRS
jgi:hypothetical protein